MPQMTLRRRHLLTPKNAIIPRYAMRLQHVGRRVASIQATSIAIALAPEVQAELVRQAAKRELRVDAYSTSLIESAARLSNGAAPAAANSATRRVPELHCWSTLQ
jgi:hypothetical protein